MTESILQVEHVSVVFHHDGGETRALDSISFDVPAGQFVVAIGPSGQGKSTLLRVIAGLQGTSEGRVIETGDPVEGPNRERGMIFQQDSAFPWLRVIDNVAYGLRMRGMRKAERTGLAAKYVDAVGLTHYQRAWPKELSGGMRKRVAIAAAFAADPSILLMDEPFGSLDFVTRAKLHEMLLELWGSTGKTILFVTHDVDEALKLADRIIVISNGRLVDDLEVSFGRPRTDALRADPPAIEMRQALLGRLGLEPGSTRNDSEAGAVGP